MRSHRCNCWQLSPAWQSAPGANLALVMAFERLTAERLPIAFDGVAMSAETSPC
jgi:hypothetical protein